MEDLIPPNNTLANDDGAHKAFTCSRSSFFSVFYGRDPVAEVKDNNLDVTLACDDGEYGEVKCEKKEK